MHIYIYTYIHYVNTLPDFILLSNIRLYWTKISSFDRLCFFFHVITFKSINLLLIFKPLTRLKLQTAGASDVSSCDHMWHVPVQCSGPPTPDLIARGAVPPLPLPHTRAVPRPAPPPTCPSVLFLSVPSQVWDVSPPSPHHRPHFNQPPCLQACSFLCYLDVADKSTFLKNHDHVTSLFHTTENSLMGGGGSRLLRVSFKTKQVCEIPLLPPITPMSRVLTETYPAKSATQAVPSTCKYPRPQLCTCKPSSPTKVG